MAAVLDWMWFSWSSSCFYRFKNICSCILRFLRCRFRSSSLALSALFFYCSIWTFTAA